MATTIKVTGLRELGAAMNALGKDMSGKIARSMTNAAAQVVKKDAMSRAPVLTGNLKRNIIVKRIPPRETNLASQHIVTVRAGKLSARQKERGLQDAFYAKFVEFGTVKTPAKPFLRPAFESQKTQAIAAMVERGKARIEKANKK